MKRFPDVQFITASEAAKLYRDRARSHEFTAAETQGDRRGRRRRRDAPSNHNDYDLSASEVFDLLNELRGLRTRRPRPAQTYDWRPRRLGRPASPPGWRSR